MAEYNYQGVDRDGKKVSGKLEAQNEGELRMSLRGIGVRPLRISKVNVMNADLGTLFSGGSSNTLSAEVLVGFTRQLQVLISSGIPIVQSLDVLSEQTTDRSLKRIVAVLKEKVSSGNYLWEAMAAYPKAFPKLYISLIRAGESSGAIDQMLKRLSRYIEDADRVRKMVKSAMMYPIIVVSIGGGVVGAMLTFVIPKFEELLKSGGQELPAPTRIVINMSHFLVSNLGIIVGSLVGGIYLLMQWSKSESGKVILDRFMFKVPLFGTMMQKAGTARFSRTLQTLLASGVNLVDAIDICKATIDNAVLEEAVATIRQEIEAGKTLGSVVGNLGVFPRMASQMIMVGESTGNLDKMLEKVADFYEEEVETLVGGLSKLIEPIVLVFLGSTVGGIMIAMYLPIFKIAGSAD